MPSAGKTRARLERKRKKDLERKRERDTEEAAQGLTDLAECARCPFDCQSAAVSAQNVCVRATAIERTGKVVRTLRRAAGGCLGGERRTNSRVGRASARTTTRQCNYKDAKAAQCMCLMHADGDKQRDEFLRPLSSFSFAFTARKARAVRRVALSLDGSQLFAKGARG